MFDRIMATLFLVGGVALAVYLYHGRYAAPACDADAVASSLSSQIKAKVGQSGVYLLNAKETEGGFFSSLRHCQVDAAPIVDLVPLGRGHWVKVHYEVKLDRQSGAVRVTSDVGSAVRPSFPANS